MLIWLLNTAFQIADFALGLLLFTLLVFFAARLIAPENKYVLLAGKYLEIVLVPIAGWIGERFPKVKDMGFDTSPMALWLMVLIVKWLLQFLQRIIL